MLLEKLSDDLLIELVEWVGTDLYFPGHVAVARYGTQFLRPLALCSRRLNEIVTSVLYKTFVQSGKHALPTFLRRVLVDPGIGRRVEKLVGSENVGSENEECDISSFAEEDFSRCLTAIRAASLSEEDAQVWMDEARLGSWDALTGVLLTLLPNLKELFIKSYGSAGHRYVPRALKLAALCQKLGGEHRYSLQHLESASVACWDTEYGLEIQHIIPFLQIPSVKTTIFHMIADESFTAPELYSTAPLEFSTTELRLGHSAIEPESLVSFLQCFRDLKIFYYDCGGALVGFADFLPQAVGRAIAHLKSSLEVLFVSDYFQETTNGDEGPKSIGSLVGFKTLHTIGMNARILVGDAVLSGEEPDNETPPLVDILPKSLKSLGIKECGKDVLKQVDELLARRDELVPLLNSIHLTFQDRRPYLPSSANEFLFPGYDKTMAEKLKLDCGRFGIKLDVRLINWRGQIEARSYTDTS